MEKGHGHVEAREYHVLDASHIAKIFPDWVSLKSIGMAINYRNNGQKESLEYRYYISDALLTTEQFGKAARGHWGIKSKLHWVLDKRFVRIIATYTVVTVHRTLPVYGT